MTVPKITTYPAALTNKEWQKKKSFMDKAKSKTKTGLAVKLNMAESTWKAIKWDTLDATKQVITTAKLADEAKQRAQQHLDGEVQNAIDALEAAEKIARTAKSNKALSNTAKQAAAALEIGLGKQRRLLEGIKLTDFDRAKTNIIQVLFDTNLETIKNRLVKADEFIRAVKQDPTRKTFNAGIQAACRHLTVPLGTIGASATKPDPRPLMKPLEAWADGKELLDPLPSPQMERRVVLETLKYYEKTINAIKKWAA